MLNYEKYLDFLRSQYHQEVKMIIRETHTDFNTFLDVERLNKKLKALNSSNESLGENDWLDLVFELCPEVYDDLDFGPVAA